MKLRTIQYIIIIILLSITVQAATLQGSIYNTRFELEENVLVEIDTTPLQKFLSTDGLYSFILAPGTYILTARKGFLETKEEVKIVDQGTFVLDIFLLPNFSEEDQLLEETNQDFFAEERETPQWAYWVTAFIIILLLARFLKIRKKYGPLRKFRKEAKHEQRKTIQEIKEDIANEPGYLERALELIEKSDGRITQKELRKEMLPLSEAKISLIVTELEHRGKIEKIKKGRGNVIILKGDREEE